MTGIKGIDDVLAMINRLRNDSRFRLRAATLFFALVAYFLALSFTFALFTSRDQVTNRFTAESVGIELREPEWDSRGSLMAAAAEPGMVIPKDPFAENTGRQDVAVRLRLAIRLDKSEYHLPQGGADADMLRPADDTARKIAILRSLTGADGSPIVTVEPLAGRTAEGNSVSVRGADGNMYLLGFSDTKANADGDRFSQFLVEVYDGQDAEDFDLCFYYIGDNPIGGTGRYQTDSHGVPYTRDDTSLALLFPDSATPRLFSYLVCPIYRKDYLTVFDRGYDINVYAEGIPYREFEERELPCTVNSFKAIAAG